MNGRERLREAYENVSFSADRTWAEAGDAFRRSNLELCLTERRLQRRRLQGPRPRTVRECIPGSRLAQYADYVYNESREMSYSSSGGCADSIFAPAAPSEPWEMPEVGELYRWFLKTMPEDDFSRLEGRYESPLLSVSGFEDKILKIQITEDRVKNIWSGETGQWCDHPTTGRVVVSFFTSPMKNFFLFDNCDYDRQWFRNISITRDFEQLEKLSKSFKDQHSLVSKLLTGTAEGIPCEPTSTEILYSEVLQGLTPSRKFMSVSRPEVKAPAADDPAILGGQKLDEPAKSDSFLYPPASVPAQTKFAPSRPSAFLQPETRCKHPLLPSRIPPLPLSPTYVPQTYFYPQVQAVQRWIPLNLTNSYYPPQVFNPGWYPHSPPVEVNRIFGPSNKVSSDRNPCDAFRRSGNPLTFDRVEDAELQFKEEAEDPLVSASVSEELEIQALEQYSNSNENFYQELERQAQEQYTSSPE